MSLSCSPEDSNDYVPDLEDLYPLTSETFSRQHHPPSRCASEVVSINTTTSLRLFSLTTLYYFYTTKPNPSVFKRKKHDMAFDFSLLMSNLLVGASVAVSAVAWLVAFIGQILVESNYQSAEGVRGSAAGTLWFAIFLQLFLIAAVIFTMATSILGVHRFQLGIWTAIALVFSVMGVDRGIYGIAGAMTASKAMGAGYLLLSFVNIFWLLFFTSDESSVIFHTINGFSQGPSLISRSGRGSPGQLRRSSSAQNINGGPVSHSDYHNTSNGMIQTGSYNGFGKDRASHGSLHSQASLGNPAMNNRAMSPMGNGSIRNMSQPQSGAGEPLMGSPSLGAPVARARALYAYQASADDPNEISFAKGEMLDVLDQSGKWWQSRRADGSVGIVPSNYLKLETDA